MRKSRSFCLRSPRQRHLLPDASVRCRSALPDGGRLPGGDPLRLFHSQNGFRLLRIHPIQKHHFRAFHPQNGYLPLRRGFSAADRSVRQLFSAADCSVRQFFSAADRSVRQLFSAVDCSVRQFFSAADRPVQRVFFSADRSVQRIFAAAGRPPMRDVCAAAARCRRVLSVCGSRPEAGPPAVRNPSYQTSPSVSFPAQPASMSASCAGRRATSRP